MFPVVVAPQRRGQIGQIDMVAVLGNGGLDQQIDAWGVLLGVDGVQVARRAHDELPKSDIYNPEKYDDETYRITELPGGHRFAGIIGQNVKYDDDDLEGGVALDIRVYKPDVDDFIQACTNAQFADNPDEKLMMWFSKLYSVSS